MKPEIKLLINKYFPNLKLLKIEENEIDFFVMDDFERTNHEKAEDAQNLVDFLKSHRNGIYKFVSVRSVFFQFDLEEENIEEKDFKTICENEEELDEIYFICNDPEVDDFMLIIKMRRNET